MATVKVIRTINGPANVVFQAVADPRCFAEAISGVTHLEFLSEVTAGSQRDTWHRVGLGLYPGPVGNGHDAHAVHDYSEPSPAAQAADAHHLRLHQESGRTGPRCGEGLVRGCAGHDWARPATARYPPAEQSRTWVTVKSEDIGDR